MRAALETAHLYPDGSGFYLVKAIAAKLGLAPENIILGNGSNEALEFLGHAFLDATRQDEVIASKYAFVVYKLITTSFGVSYTSVGGPMSARRFGYSRTGMAVARECRAVPDRCCRRRCCECR